jgi:hypothetical protein
VECLVTHGLITLQINSNRTLSCFCTKISNLKFRPQTFLTNKNSVIAPPLIIATVIRPMWPATTWPLCTSQSCSREGAQTWSTQRSVKMIFTLLTTQKALPKTTEHRKNQEIIPWASNLMMSHTNSSTMTVYIISRTKLYPLALRTSFRRIAPRISKNLHLQPSSGRVRPQPSRLYAAVDNSCQTLRQALTSSVSARIVTN